MIDIGRTIGAGVRVVREHPVAFAVWAVFNTVLTGATQFAMLPLMRLSSAGAANISPAEMGTAMVPMTIFPMLQFILQIVIWAAVYRAVFRPEESTFAYLRLGGDEFRLFVIGVIFTVIFFMAVFIPALLFGGITGFTATMSAQSPGTSIAIIVIIALLAGLLFLLAGIFFSVRLSLAWPLTFWRREIVFGQAWQLSRGNFWPMLASALVIVVFMYLASIMIAALQYGGLMIPGIGGDPQEVNMRMLASMREITPVRIVAIILGGIVATGWIVAMGAGIADAALQLMPNDHEDLEETFS